MKEQNAKTFESLKFIFLKTREIEIENGAFDALYICNDYDTPFYSYKINDRQIFLL